MSLLGINVWFMCKHCNGNSVYFKNLIEFVEHKKKDHFIEFRNVRCIVFEERTNFHADTPGAEVSPEFTCDSTFEPYNNEVEEVNNFQEIENKLDTDLLIISSPPSVFDRIVIPHNPNIQTEEIFLNEANSELNDQIQLINSSVNVGEELDIEILPDFPCQNEQSAATLSFVTITTNTNNAETTISPLPPASKSTKKRSLSKHIPVSTTSKNRIKKPKRIDKNLKSIQSTQLIPNPYICVRRLTPMEIQNVSSAAATGHQANLIGEDPPKLKRRRGRQIFQSMKFECTSCHKIIGSRSRYTYHLKICGRARVKKKRIHHPRVCEECGIQCFDLSSLKIHKLRKHSTKEEKAVIYQYTCPHCPGRSFLHKSILDDHTKVHHGLKPNLCHECGMSFLRPSHLAKHVLLHSDEAPFRCQEPNCGKGFKIQSYLEVHMASHSKTRPFPCTDPNCKKTFTHPSYVRKHLQQVPHGDAAKAKAKAMKAKGSVSTGTEILSNN